MVGVVDHRVTGIRLELTMDHHRLTGCDGHSLGEGEVVVDLDADSVDDDVEPLVRAVGTGGRVR